MKKFKTWRDYYIFSKTVKNEFRYIHDKEINNFLEALKSSIPKYEAVIERNNELFRAQKGSITKMIYEPQVKCKIEIERPYTKDRMLPPSIPNSSGRVHSPGIFCFYCASTKETAMSEMRPWLGALISVAAFKTTKELNVIDCSKYPRKNKVYLSNPSPNKRQNSVWNDINIAFSIPVFENSYSIDYVPTQIIAELIKKMGYDGIVYKSSYNEGLNIALFSIKGIKLIQIELFEVSKIEHQFSDKNENRIYK